MGTKVILSLAQFFLGLTATVVLWYTLLEATNLEVHSWTMLILGFCAYFIFFTVSAACGIQLQQIKKQESDDQPEEGEE